MDQNPIPSDNALPPNGILRLSGLEARIVERISPTLEDLGYELVRLSVLGHETPTVQIMADRSNGALITVEDCEQISHAVGAVLDVDDPIPGAWTLEVSSSGIDRPLTRPKDWERYAGHFVRAEMDVAIEGRKRFAGIVIGLRDKSALIRLNAGEEVLLPLLDMRKARLVLTDELIEASAMLAGLSEDNGEEKQRGKKGRVPKLNPKKPGKKN